MSNTLKHRALRYIHKFPYTVSRKEIIDSAPDDIKEIVKRVLLENLPSRGLPIRTGSRTSRYGNDRKYYAEMKLRGRRRMRAINKQEFQKIVKDTDL